jgi:transposase-like protein
MERVPHGKYTREFRLEAMKLVTEDKLSVAEAARRLALPPNTSDNWLKKQRGGKLEEVGKTYRPLTELGMELARVKKENSEQGLELTIGVRNKW